MASYGLQQRRNAENKSCAEGGDHIGGGVLNVYGIWVERTAETSRGNVGKLDELAINLCNSTQAYVFPIKPIENEAGSLCVGCLYDNLIQTETTKQSRK